VRGLSTVFLIFVLTVALGGSASRSAPSATPISTPATVVFYGDSILSEAHHALVADFVTKPGWTVKVNDLPAAAVCDWQSKLRYDLAALHPKIVVLETFGVSLTPCMHGLIRSTPAWEEKYRSDLNLFLRTATDAGARVLLVKPVVIDPIRARRKYHAYFPGPYSKTLTSIAMSDAKKYPGVSVTAAPPDSLLTSTGSFTLSKACRAGESAAMGCDAATRTILVRNPDGIHLCPLAYKPPLGMFAGCPIYSSGAVRYASALAAVAVNPPAPLLP